MPPCTHCQYTRCPKCGHDCAKEPLLPKVFRIKADDCDRWYKGECSLGPVFTDDESEAELFSTVIECNRKMRHEDVTGCFIERVESSSQGIVDNSGGATSCDAKGENKSSQKAQIRNGSSSHKTLRVASLKIDNERGEFSGESPFPDDLMLAMGLRRVEVLAKPGSEYSDLIDYDVVAKEGGL